MADVTSTRESRSLQRGAEAKVPEHDTVLEIHHIGCDGPYGDCTIVNYKKLDNNFYTFVIDGGYTDDLELRGYQTIHEIDSVLLTHWHKDHFAGLQGSAKLKRAFSKKPFQLCCGNANDANETKSVHSRVKKDLGFTIDINDKNYCYVENLTNASIKLRDNFQMDINLFSPFISDDGVTKKEKTDENRHSIVCQIKLKNRNTEVFNYLTLADITKKSISEDLVKCFGGDIDVVRFSHHGSKENFSEYLENYIEETDEEKKPKCIISGYSGKEITTVINNNFTKDYKAHVVTYQISDATGNLNAAIEKIQLHTSYSIYVDNTGKIIYRDTDKDMDTN